MEALIDWLENSRINEMTKKTSADVFGFMGDLTEKGRLRHYQRLLTILSREFSGTYKYAYTADRGGERIFILSKDEEVPDSVILTLKDRLD
jgi:hypothetical protein